MITTKDESFEKAWNQWIKGGRIFSISAMILLPFYVSCTKHIPMEKDPPTWEKEGVIYVTLLSGEKYQIKKPRVEGDSLSGMTPANFAVPGDKEIRIALADIKHIEIERSDRTKTVIAFALVAIPVGLLILVLSSIPTDLQ